MPRQQQQQRSRKETDRIARQFFDDKLRNDATLRQRCEDRHVLDETITAWKDEQRLIHGVPILGMPRSQFIYSLRTRWKLIDAKITEENVIVWSDKASANAAQQQQESAAAFAVVPAHYVKIDTKAEKIAKTIERIRNSRQEMESNRDGIIIDQIVCGQGVNEQQGGGVVLRIGEVASQTVCIRNNSSTDVHCWIKAAYDKVHYLPFWRSR